MIFGTGVDIVEVKRFSKLINNPDFINRFFNKEEQKEYNNVQALCEHYASRFAAKEAFGKAEVYIDSVKKYTFDGKKEGGWNDCVQEVIIDEASTGIHTVEVKMAAGDENKGFTILAFGYTK